MGLAGLAIKRSESAIELSGVVKSGIGISASKSAAIQKAWLWVKSASNASVATISNCNFWPPCAICSGSAWSLK